MCVDTMDTKTRTLKTTYLRKTMKLVPKLRKRLLRVSSEDEASLFRRADNTMKAAIRKCLRREWKRTQLAKLIHVVKKVKDMDDMENMSRHAAADHRPRGATAPPNTTQYLMERVYDDMPSEFTSQPSYHHTSDGSMGLYDESLLSPSTMYVDLDSEPCLAFQQRDFEEAFGLSASC